MHGVIWLRSLEGRARNLALNTIGDSHGHCNQLKPESPVWPRMRITSLQHRIRHLTLNTNNNSCGHCDQSRSELPVWCRMRTSREGGLRCFGVSNSLLVIYCGVWLVNCFNVMETKVIPGVFLLESYSTTVTHPSAVCTIFLCHSSSHHHSSS